MTNLTTDNGGGSLIDPKYIVQERKYNIKTTEMVQEIFSALKKYDNPCKEFGAFTPSQATFFKSVYEPIMDGPLNSEERFNFIYHARRTLISKGGKGLIEELMGEDRMKLMKNTIEVVGAIQGQHDFYLALEDEKRNGKGSYGAKWSEEQKYDERIDRPLTIAAFNERIPLDELEERVIAMECRERVDLEAELREPWPTPAAIKQARKKAKGKKATYSKH